MRELEPSGLSLVDELYDIIDALNELADGGSIPKGCEGRGLCSMFDLNRIAPYRISHHWYYLCIRLIKNYPYGIGNQTYPVPGGEQAYDAAVKAWCKGSKTAFWGRHKYGDERRKLCRWLADELEDLINECGEDEE